ncbi:clarin-3 [Brachionichthys hirsutus]|uniref:clarin-3 n=1 Tax=Brachionichthys hirsutus TaxID=412623 RepID=UPI0036045D09
MPSTKKTLYFLSSGLATSLSVMVLGYGMSRKWSTTTMDCSEAVNASIQRSADVTLELFDCTVERNLCPIYGASSEMEVIPALAGAPLVLHVLVLVLLVASLLFSATSILISLYNSVSNPYETYVGPLGIYVSGSLSACLSVLAMIVFVLNVSFTDMTKELVWIVVKDVDLRDASTQMLLGFYLVIPYTALSLLAILVIYLYEHAAYTHRKEQQNPTEDAPIETMMY